MEKESGMNQARMLLPALLFAACAAQAGTYSVLQESDCPLVSAGELSRAVQKAGVVHRLAQLRGRDAEDLAPIGDVGFAQQVDDLGRRVPGARGDWGRGHGLLPRSGRAGQMFMIETARALRYASTASGPPSEP
jgi:hypothetical protein